MTNTELARKVNNALGPHALAALYCQLTDAELNQMIRLMSHGLVNLHTDGTIGFTISTDSGWTSEGLLPIE